MPQARGREPGPGPGVPRGRRGPARSHVDRATTAIRGSGRQVRSLEYTDATRVDDVVVQEFLDHAVPIGEGLRAR